VHGRDRVQDEVEAAEMPLHLRGVRGSRRMMVAGASPELALEAA
jgi:hypothetical protein